MSNAQTAPQETVTIAAKTAMTTIDSEGTTTTPTSLTAFCTSMCLLKMAIAIVSAGQTTVEDHILFDKGVPSPHKSLQISYTFSQCIMKISKSHYENI